MPNERDDIGAPPLTPEQRLLMEIFTGGDPMDLCECDHYGAHDLGCPAEDVSDDDR